MCMMHKNICCILDVCAGYGALVLGIWQWIYSPKTIFNGIYPRAIECRMWSVIFRMIHFSPHQVGREKIEGKLFRSAQQLLFFKAWAATEPWAGPMEGHNKCCLATPHHWWEELCRLSITEGPRDSETEAHQDACLCLALWEMTPLMPW